MRTLAFALVQLALLLMPSAAAADTATGGVTVALDAKSRLAKAARFAGGSPARATRRTWRLPAYDATVGTRATLRHSGVLQIKARGRRLNLTGLRTVLAPGASRTTARVASRRITVLTYTRRPAIRAGRARLASSRARLTAAAAGVLRRKLGLRRLRAGRIGTADVAVALAPDVPAPTPNATPTPTPTGPGSPAPATQRIVWRPRESFIRYMASEDGKVTVSGAAQEGPQEVRPGSDAPLVYSFRFPTGTGTLAFRWASRGIDLSFTDPRVTGNRMTAVAGGETAGSSAGRRVDLLDLAVSKADADGYPATLTAEGAQVFAGYYGAGDEWGHVSVTAATASRSASIARAAKRKPLRVVALSPFTANTLVDLGIKPVAIANTLGGQDRFRPQLRGVRRLTLSHPNGPNLEQLAALDPDVVLSSPTWRRGHAAMRSLGMRVVLADPTRVANVAAMTRKLGALVGRARRAARLARRQQADVRRAVRGVERRPRVLVVLGVGRSPYAFLPGSWGGDLVTRSGGRLLTEALEGDGGFARISDEEVVARDPDVIIAVPHGNAKDIPSLSEYLADNPAWASTSAARNGRVHVARGNALLQAFTDTGRTIRDIGTMFLKNR